MSWDIHIVKSAYEGEPPEQILEDEARNAAPFGSPDEVRRGILQVVSGVDFSHDATYGVLSCDSWSMEFNLGSADPVGSLMLHIRGSDESFLPTLRVVCEQFRAHAYDTSLGRFIDFDCDPAAGFREWRESVARVAEFYRHGSLNGERPRVVTLRVPGLCRAPLRRITDTAKRLFRKK